MSDALASLRTSHPAGEAWGFRVRYFETDQMGVAHHANYFVWFESARSEFCRVRNIDYIAMERSGLYMPILECRCRHRAAARYDDELTVYTYVKERTRRTLKMGYSVLRGNEELAEGETTQMIVDASGRPRSFPEAMAALFDLDGNRTDSCDTVGL